MKITLISYKRLTINKILRPIYVLIIGGGIGLMVPGVGSGETLYTNWNVPLWVYILTITILFIITILGFANILTGIPKIGFINITNKGIKIEKLLSSREIKFESIQSIVITPNYLTDKVSPTKNNRTIEMSIEGNTEKFNAILSKKEEEELIQLISKLI